MLALRSNHSSSLAISSTWILLASCDMCAGLLAGNLRSGAHAPRAVSISPRVSLFAVSFTAYASSVSLHKNGNHTHHPSGGIVDQHALSFSPIHQIFDIWINNKLIFTPPSVFLYKTYIFFVQFPEYKARNCHPRASVICDLSNLHAIWLLTEKSHLSWRKRRQFAACKLTVH